MEISRFSALVQFVKFGMVGVMNTIISYATEMLCYYVFFSGANWFENTVIVMSSVIAFAVSVTNAYYWNNRFVFRNEERKGFKKHLIAYGKTVLCYALTGLIIAPLLKIWLTGMEIPYWGAVLLTLIVTVPMNFLMNKFWAFGERKGKQKDEL